MSRRILKTHEIAEALELLVDEDVNDIDVYVDPPGDGALSDGDSGDENCNDIDRLNRHQLLAPAEIIVHQCDDDELNGTINDESIDDINVLIPSSSSSTAVAKRSRRAVQPTNSIASTSRGALSSNNINPRITPSSRGGASLSNQGSRGTITRAAVSSTSRKSTARQRNWIKQDLPQNSEQWVPPPPRAVTTLSKDSSPIEFFELFFNEEVIRYIVRHSVLYAVSKDHNTNFTLSGDEIYCFIGILILSGYAPLPRRRMYWEFNEDTHNVLVSKSMRRNRFEEIFRYFHLADNDNLRSGDKMAKVRPLFEMLNEKFLTYAPIEKNFSVDESMIPYYGRHGCKQHIHGKPIRFGFKAWVAATRLGYCLQVDLYEGRTEARETGLGEHVVTKLTEKIRKVYPDPPFSVYCDNFFTSPTLLSVLKEKDVKITGTVRQNRVDKCPLIDVKACKKQPRGSYDFMLDTNDNISAVRWNDNSVVTLLSNEFGVHPVQKAQRYSVAEHKKIDIDQPNVVHQYNRFMGGVDRLDANVGVYRISIRGKKWYAPIWMWLIDVAVNNCTLLARSWGANVDTLEFRRSIARTLLQKYGSAKTHPGPEAQKMVFNIPHTIRTHSAQHMIITGQTRKRCALCKNKTVKMCRKCGVNLHDKCFIDFHA